MLKSPKFLDLILFVLVLIALIFNPYFSQGQINTFETGLYLPGINSVLNGGVPFKDFLHLRGPLEIYMPSLLMKIFGEHLNVLYAYFYIGNVLCLILCVLIAKELFKTRMMFYLFVPVLVGRTFPRAVFTFWGGMRFSWGLLAVLLLIHFIKKKRFSYLFFTGVVSSLAVLTSIDVGVCSILGVISLLIFELLYRREEKLFIIKAFFIYIGGSIIVLLPYSVYLFLTGSLHFFIESMYSIVFTLTKVMPDFIVEDQPKNLIQAISGLNPLSRHFKYLTPAYCYIFSLVFAAFEFKKKRARSFNSGFMAVFFYGLLLFIFSFRKIGTSVFEMAIQPEKILLFFMLEITVLSIIQKIKYLFADIKATPRLIWASLKGLRLFLIYFCILGVICSSLGYSYMRFSRRYFTFRYLIDKVNGKDTSYLMPLNDEPSRILTVERAKGIRVPAWQADDIESVTRFIQANTNKNDAVLMSPELGFYSFIVDRPFIGKFPMITFSWFGRRWHEQFMNDLMNARPEFAVVSKEEGPSFKDFYFRVRKNIRNYEQLTRYIDNNYEFVMQTPSLKVYRRKDE